jgi:hypothetical protein
MAERALFGALRARHHYTFFSIKKKTPLHNKGASEILYLGIIYGANTKSYTCFQVLQRSTSLISFWPRIT